MCIFIWHEKIKAELENGAKLVGVSPLWFLCNGHTRMLQEDGYENRFINTTFMMTPNLQF